jgi:hypothetical protein
VSQPTKPIKDTLTGVECRFLDAAQNPVAWVTVPAQSSGKTLQISNSKDFQPWPTPPTPSGFEPIVSVVNFQIEEHGDPTKMVTNFAPPMILRVATPDLIDVDARVKPWLKLKLAYLDAAAQDWVILTKKDHHLDMRRDHVTVLISEWVGDPTVAWGQ